MNEGYTLKKDDNDMLYIDMDNPPELSNIQLWEKINQEIFGGNPYAQIADLTKSQVITLALLTPIVWKDTIKLAFASLIETLKKVSDARVQMWLSPFDLSFLD